MKRYYLKLSPKSQLGYDAPPLKEWVKRNGYQFKYANNVLAKMSDELLLYYDEKTKELYTHQMPKMMLFEEWETRGFDGHDVLIDKIVDEKDIPQPTMEEKIAELKAFQKRRRARINKEKREERKRREAKMFYDPKEKARRDAEFLKMRDQFKK
tara:strand:+ start:2861 stop:3322 length:462 start_codon:yes stop_codon:yes gene_type:complete